MGPGARDRRRGPDAAGAWLASAAVALALVAIPGGDRRLHHLERAHPGLSRGHDDRGAPGGATRRPGRRAAAAHRGRARARERRPVQHRRRHAGPGRHHAARERPGQRSQGAVVRRPDRARRGAREPGQPGRALPAEQDPGRARRFRGRGGHLPDVHPRAGRRGARGARRRRHPGPRRPHGAPPAPRPARQRRRAAPHLLRAHRPGDPRAWRTASRTPTGPPTGCGSRR